MKKTPLNKTNESGYDISIKGIIESAPNTVPIGIAIAINRTFFFVNDFYCDILEYSREELVGKITRVIYPTDENYEFVGKEIQIQLKKYGHGTLETRAKTKSGKIKDLIASYSMIDKKDPEKGIVFAIIDITENKKIENDLKQSESQYQELYNNMSTCVAIYEPNDQGNDFVIKGINKAGEEKSKVKLEEIKGKNVSEVFPSVKEIGLFDVFKRVYATGKPEYLPTRFYKDNRISEWVENYVYKLPSGEIVAMYEDTSERKIAEELLRKSEEKYRRMIDTSNEGIWIIDDHYITTFANSKMSEILGYTTKEIIGKSAGIFLYDNDINLQVNRMAARTEGVSQNYELALKKKNGEKLWALVSATPILDDQGNFKGSFAMFTDITERKQNEEIIKQLNENLKLLNKILRHDISNDLTVVSLSLEMIETKEEDIKNKAFNAIKRSVDLIEKIRVLESTMITRYDLKPVDVGQISSFIKKTYPYIGINIKGKCNAKADEAFMSVIDNIINNAITHGKTDNIDIEITSDKNICQIKIIDYGRGIPNSIKSKIFDEEFSYGKSGGTGLGLFIAKRTIERYGGTIEVKDTKPHGATFIIKLKTYEL